MFLDFGDLPDERFELLIIFGPLLGFGFELPRDIEGDRFPRLFPGDVRHRMLGALVMAGAVFFAALSGSGDEGSFDPGVEVWDLAGERKTFSMELGA